MDKEARKSALQLATASSMGIALVLTIFGSFYLGLFLDNKLGTGRVFSFLFLFLGIFVGFKNFYLLIKKTFSDDKKENEGKPPQENSGDKHHGKGPPAEND